MFIGIKKIFKSNFGKIYSVIRYLFLDIYMKFRTKSLNKFNDIILYNFSYSDVLFNIFLNPENGFIDKEIFWKGVYEEDFLDFIKKELKDDYTYVDIGSNIGQHALFAARILKNGNVYAFEPNYKIYSQLMRSVEANPDINNIEVFNIGLGSEKKEEIFFINKGNVGGSSLLNYKEGMNKVSIMIDRGDVFLFNLDRVDFIKIDVEGYEYEALIGLQNTLHKFKPKMLIEFTPVFYDKKDKNDGINIIDLLLKYNYVFSDLESSNINKVYKNKEEMMDWLINLHKDQTNIFCY